MCHWAAGRESPGHRGSCSAELIAHPSLQLRAMSGSHKKIQRSCSILLRFIFNPNSHRFTPSCASVQGRSAGPCSGPARYAAVKRVPGRRGNAGPIAHPSSLRIPSDSSHPSGWRWPRRQTPGVGSGCCSGLAPIARPAGIIPATRR